MARTLRSAAVALLISVAGCTQDPFERPGTWQPTGANERNLRAMIQNERDLSRGVGAINERGNAGANATTRLFIERRRPLPVVPSSTVGGAASQQQSDPPLPGLSEGNGGTSR
jgi:hypothetical protein